APAHVAEQAAEQRADRDADAEGRLVEDDRRTAAAGCRAHDCRERGGDEEGVAESPSGAESDDGLDAAAEARERREHDDEGETDQQGPAGADAAGDPAREEHHRARHEQVAREQQLGLGGRRVQVGRDRGKDRIDESDAHERDDAREGDRPDRARLAQDVGAVTGGTVRAHEAATAASDASRVSSSEAAASSVAQSASLSSPNHGSRVSASCARHAVRAFLPFSLTTMSQARESSRSAIRVTSSSSTMVPSRRVMPGWVTRLAAASSPTRMGPSAARIDSVRHWAAGVVLPVAWAARRVRRWVETSRDSRMSVCITRATIYPSYI